MIEENGRAFGAAQLALARVKPDYFAWPAEAQERYRCTMTDAERLVVRTELLSVLFGIHTETPQDVWSTIKALSPTDRLLYENAELSTSGVGDDFFWSLDVQNHTGRPIVDFATLHDFDIVQWNIQPHSDIRVILTDEREKLQIDNVQPEPGPGYRGFLCDEWAALRIDDAFSRASLSMAAHYVTILANRVYSTRILEFQSPSGWPLKNGNPISKRKTKRYAQELYSRFSSYMQQREDALFIEFDESARGAVYIFDASTAECPDTHFVFSDKAVLKAVRFRHFVRDCQELLRDGSELDSVIERERLAASEFLEAAHREIIQNSLLS